MINNAAKLSSETQSMLHNLLKSLLGSAVTIRQIEIINHHHDYVALVVSIDHPALQLAVKLAGKETPYPYPFDRTAYWHQLVAERTSIHMPAVIAVDTSYRNYSWRYLIKRYVPGEVWATVRPKLTPTELRHAYHQIGEAVGQLHAIQFEHFGDAVDNPHAASNPDFYTTLVERIQSSIRNSRIKHDFLALLARHQNLFREVTQPRLCHDDLHPYNVLFHQTAGQWQLATLLDFDKAWAGHHEIDLAKLALWTGMTGDGFCEGYNQHMYVDDDHAARRPLYQLWWCLDFAANTPRHLADTQHLCTQLDFPLIERFE